MEITTFVFAGLFIGNSIGIQQNDEPYPTDLILAAEDFAREQNIAPEMILLLSVGSVLTNNGAKTKCNMLSVVTLVDLVNVRVGRTDFPTVLRETLRVVLISRYHMALFRLEFGGLDAIRFIRHRVSLHIITSGSNTYYVPTVPTLVWKQDEPRLFYCVHSFDNLIFWNSKPSTQTCKALTSTCELSRITQSLGHVSARLLLEVTLEFRCNSTEVSAQYLANSPYSKLTTDFLDVNLYMRTQYLTKQFNILECYTAYRIRATDLTALLLPFEADAWFATLLSALLTASGLSFAVGKRLTTTLKEILLGFIAASSVDIKLRRFSSLIAGCSTIMIIFFINQIYSNCIMSVSLNPLVYDENVEDLYDCQFAPVCRDNPQFFHAELELGKAVCSLTQSMKSHYGKPLHRFLKTEIKSKSQIHDPFWMLQKSLSRTVSGDHSKGGHSLVFTRRSEIVNNFFQYGTAPLKRFEYMYAHRRRKVLGAIAGLSVEAVTLLHKKVTVMVERSGLEKKQAYSGGLEISFDLENFLKLLPLFGLCLISTVTCFAFELFAKQVVWFFRHRRRKR